MARTYPSFHATGTIAIDPDPAQLLFDIIAGHLATFTTSGASTPAWEIWHTISANDLIYRSRGDRTLANGAGDAAIFLQLRWQSTTQVRVRVYQDYSPNDGAGSRFTNEQTISLSTSQVATYWIALNEYELATVINRSTTWDSFMAGMPFRSHIPLNHRGVAFTTGAVAPGASVSIPLDRDMTDSTFGGLQVNEQVWIYNVNTGGSEVLGSAIVELVTIDSITATEIVVSNVVGSFNSGAIVGLDPCPMYRCEAEISGTLPTMVNDINGAVASLSTGKLDRWRGTETSHDPAAGTGMVHGAARLLVSHTSAAAQPYRGTYTLIARCPDDGVTDSVDPTNFYRANFDDTKKFWAFPGLGNVSGFITIMGPLGEGF